MKRYLIIGIMAMMILSVFVFANSEETFAEAEQLIKNRVSCDALGNDQLEIIGDYYMEQMHPGELHEIMDQRMGGEGSEQLQQVHISMARSFYCGEQGMMNTMMGRTGGMMGYGGMMNDYGYCMMGNWGYGYSNILTVLYVILLIGMIILVYLGIVKLWRNLNRKPR